MLSRSVALISFTVALVVTAQTSAAAKTSKIAYSCDTRANYYSELILPTPEGNFVISGKVQVSDVPKVGKWAPLTRIQIAQSSKKEDDLTDLAGFVFAALPARIADRSIKDKNKIIRFVTWDEKSAGSDKPHENIRLEDAGEIFEFSLAISGTEIKGSFADKEQTMYLHASDPVIRIVCSTGAFVYTELTIEKSD